MEPTPLHWIGDASNPEDRMLGEVWETSLLQTGSGFEEAGNVAMEFGVPADSVFFDGQDVPPMTPTEVAILSH